LFFWWITLFLYLWIFHSELGQMSDFLYYGNHSENSWIFWKFSDFRFIIWSHVHFHYNCSRTSLLSMILLRNRQCHIFHEKMSIVTLQFKHYSTIFAYMYVYCKYSIIRACYKYSIFSTVNCFSLLTTNTGILKLTLQRNRAYLKIPIDCTLFKINV
jgi:hypothetical protein